MCSVLTITRVYTKYRENVDLFIEPLWRSSEAAINHSNLLLCQPEENTIIIIFNKEDSLKSSITV